MASDNFDFGKGKGWEVTIPSNAEEYLTFRYGNWKVPDKNYDAGLNDGAISE
ncbi:MAG: hypothetical protein HQ509_12025 [Candidatus Marinimicrobia bacterium]|nr:hypothetical protein [Candidatus Neomarinimicrobiota bacterium]